MCKNFKINSVSVNEILKDKEIQVILNLTIPNAHYLIAKNHYLMVNMFILKNL